MMSLAPRLTVRILQITGALGAGILGFAPIAAAAPAQNGFSLNLSSQQSRDTVASTSSVSSGENARFSCGRVLFLCESQHPLMDRVAELLRDQIAGLPLIQRVEEVKTARQSGRAITAPLLPDGARAPDLFLRLELERLDEEGWVTRSFHARVKAFLGTAPWESNHSTVDDTTPPLIAFRWSGQLTHDGTVKGIEIPKYGSLATAIANQLANALTNEILKQAKEHSTLPALPDSLYGPYYPPPTLPFPAELKAERACSYYGLLTHNETFWRLHAPTNPVPVLEAVARQLTAAHWRIQTADLTNAPDWYLRAKKGDASLEVFNPSPYPEPEANPAPPRLVELIAHYREPLTHAERTAALDSLLSSQAPLETLLLFQHSFSSAQRRRLTERLETSPITTPDACLVLARERLNQKDTNAAVRLLVQAKALAQALGDVSGVESKVESIARQIRPKGTLVLNATPDTYRTLGFVEITNAPQKLEIEKELGSPALIFAVGDNAQPQTLVLRIDPPAGKSRLANWTRIQTAPGTQSTSSGQVDLTRPAGWTQSLQSLTLGAYPVQARITQGETGNQVRFELEIAPPAGRP